jgi:hypothetical protein
MEHLRDAPALTEGVEMQDVLSQQKPSVVEEDPSGVLLACELIHALVFPDTRNVVE